MGKFATGEKPKFDLITASKTKKYKIITAVVLVIGVLLLGLSILMYNMLTVAVAPNNLFVDNLSNYSRNLGTCTISQDESFTITTGNPIDRALIDPIIFELDADAAVFLQIYDQTNTHEISSSRYQGLFYLHIRKDAPTTVEKNGITVEPSGILKIKCGIHITQINITYHHK